VYSTIVDNALTICSLSEKSMALQTISITF